MGEDTGRIPVSPATDLPFCLALLPTGVAWPQRLPAAPVVSYTTFSPLPAPFEASAVCLCGPIRESPRPGVTRRRTLWSPDFPRARRRTTPPARDHLTDSSLFASYHSCRSGQSYARSSHSTSSGGEQNRARGAPNPSRPNPRLTYNVVLRSRILPRS